MIYIIGDSHVSVFSGTDKTWDGKRHIQPEFGTCYTLSQGQLRPAINKFEQKIPYFCPIKIGSNTAWNSYNKLPIIEQVISEYNITNNDYVFTCFGEIDIRHHIGFHLNGRDILEGIKETVDRYLQTLLYLKNKEIQIGAYASPPSSIGGQSGHKQYGDVKLRNKMTTYFNEYLETQCNLHSILFKNITPYLISPDFITNEERFIMDDIHLSQGAMPFIKKEFNDIICEITDNP